MTIKVTDPGYQNGRHVTPSKREYEITIEKNGVVVNTIHVFPYLHKLVLTSFAIFHSALFALAAFFSDLNTFISGGGVIIAFQLAHIALSFKIVRQDELGGLLFFGKPVKVVDSGFVLCPAGLLQLIKLPKKPIQVQFPGDPEKIFKGTDEDYFKLSEKERNEVFLPIRATTGKPKENKSGEGDILNTQMTLEVNFYVRWKIEHFWVFLIRIGSIDEANRQHRDSGERVIIQAVASRTPAEVIEALPVINEELSAKLEEITEDWGVYIIETAMLSPDVSRSVNVALRDVVVKKAEARQMVVIAEAEETKRTREGKGSANAKEAELKALAEGARALGVDGQAIIDLEKARALASGKTTIFIDGGQSLTGIGAKLAVGAQSVLSTPRTTPSE